MRTWIAGLVGSLVLGTGYLAAAPPPAVGDPTPVHGATAGDQFGTSVLCCDLDRDGRPETIVGARDTDPNGVEDAGSVFVYSGRSGQLIRRFDGTVPFGVFGVSVVCCDLNGDRWMDLAIGAANQSRVFVYSGRDGRLLRQTEPQAGAFQIGFSLACADVNADRVPDLIAGAPNFGESGSGSGAVLIFSGKDGNVLRRFDGTEFDNQLGVSVAAGDVDRDGFADIVAGAPRTDIQGVVDAGSAFVFSGRTGALLRRYDGQGTDELLGVSAAACDLNRDHYADVLIGAPNREPGGVTDAGSILAFSGRDGTLLRSFDGSAPGEHLGWGLTCGKINKDAVPDVAAGGIQGVAPPAGLMERVALFSGKSGARLLTIERPAEGGNFGLRVALCANGKGRATRILIGEQQADPDGRVDAGTVWSYPLRVR